MPASKASNLPKRLLIIRMSAIGDVVMTIPMLYSLAKAYPQTEFTLLTKKSLIKIFINSPKNIRFISADTRDLHKGFFGIIRLFRTLCAERFDAVCDLHDVMRSNIICTLFRLRRIPVTVVDKEREERDALTRKDHKLKHPLKSNFIRYYEPIAKLGFRFPLSFTSLFEENLPSSREINQLLEDAKPNTIGIAPFANHTLKVYPLEKMEQVIAHFAAKKNITIYLFGGGDNEKWVLDGWAKKFENVVSLVGKLDFSQELILMSKLNVMVSMDSSNMHLAAVSGTQVVSIWGATHRYAGFLGWNVDHTQCVEIDLPCRPCSVYGNKPCYLGTEACLNGIDPKNVINKVERFIQS